MPQAHTHVRQPSPPQQQLSPRGPKSPSTLEASPSMTPVPATAMGHVDDTTRRPHGGERARASIACVHCRKSKTKCNNKGPGTRCDACSEKNKVCDYSNTDAATTTPIVKRRESALGDVDTLPKKRKRNLEKAPTHHPYHASKDQEDPLHAPFLTPKVWEELFEIYEKHFASDFPFLHRKRFLKPLHQSNRTVASRQDSGRLPCPPYPAYLLLGFLALTARYHPEIVSRLNSDKLGTADYYAEATEKRLGIVPGKGSLEKAQAMLFLGFHRWSALKGENGWHFIGIATRYVQNLGYQKLDDERNNRKDKIRTASSDNSLAHIEDAIDREIWRRTFWSCFILDRYTGCAENRVYMINVDDIATQLPCSDEAFNKGLKVKTRFLGESDDTYRERRRTVTDEMRRSHNRIWDNSNKGKEEIMWEEGKDEAELSLYIQTVHHFGLVLSWSIGKGRRQEKYDPWDGRGRFRKLELGHQELKARLPDHLTLTPLHTEDIIYDKTKNSRNYVLIHALHSLITIALYREYMAFAPWWTNMPVGPLDEPKIVDSPPTKDYWINQARLCFGAAKDFADLLRACRGAGALVDSTIAGWATYIVGWCAMYCHIFPNMDPDRALDSRAQFTAWDLANEILDDMGDRFVMPWQWLDYLAQLHKYFRREKARWRGLQRGSNGSPSSTSSDNSGGGLKEYQSQGFESAHLQLGSHLDTSWRRNPNRDDWKLTHDAETEEPQFKSEGTPATTPRSQSGFTTVNRGKSTSEAPSLPPPSRMSWTSHPSPNATPIRTQGNYEYPQHASTVLQTPNATVDAVATSTTYNRGAGAGLHAPVLPPNPYANREHSSVGHDGSSHLAMQWQTHNLSQPQQQQSQQAQQTQMRLQGQPSMGMGFDVGNFQQGENGPRYDGLAYMDPSIDMGEWIPTYPQYNMQFPEPYEETYPAQIGR